MNVAMERERPSIMRYLSGQLAAIHSKRRWTRDVYVDSKWIFSGACDAWISTSVINIPSGGVKKRRRESQSCQRLAACNNVFANRDAIISLMQLPCCLFVVARSHADAGCLIDLAVFIGAIIRQSIAIWSCVLFNIASRRLLIIVGQFVMVSWIRLAVNGGWWCVFIYRLISLCQWTVTCADWKPNAEWHRGQKCAVYM